MRRQALSRWVAAYRLHPVLAGLGVVDIRAEYGAAAARTAVGVGPGSARREGPHLQLGVEVVRLLVVGLIVCAHVPLGVGRLSGLGSHVVQVDEQRLVLPPVRHGGVAPVALEDLRRRAAGDLVPVVPVQLVAAAAAEACEPEDVVASAKIPS